MHSTTTRIPKCHKLCLCLSLSPLFVLYLFLTFFCSKMGSSFLSPLPIIMRLLGAIMCLFLFHPRFHFFLLISFSPTTNLLESVHLLFKLTYQTCIAGRKHNIYMPSHTNMHAQAHTDTMTCLSAHLRRPIDS